MNNEMTILIAGVAALVLIILMGILARMYRKAGPNEALIVYGFRGPRVIKGHGTVIFPMVENCRELSLELMSFDVAPQQDLYTKQGVAVTVEAVAQIKVRSDQASILTAAEQFLTKPPQQREGLIRLVMEGHLRGIIGQLTVEQIVKEPEMVGDRMRGTCADDMSKMGLEVISFTIKEVRDKNEYISNMGRPDIARIKRDAEMATADAERDTAIKRATALRESAVAKAMADQERVIAETASQTRQAEAQRDLDIKKATYAEQSRRQQAQADKAYEIQTNIMQQQVTAEQVKVQQVEKEGQIKVQEAEITRHEKELIATILKEAEDQSPADRDAGRRRKEPSDGGSRGPRGCDPHPGRGRSLNYFPEGRGGSQGHDREGRGLPGVEPGRGGGQTAHEHGRRGARHGRAVEQGGQDHDRVHGQRWRRRRAQDYRRHDQDCRPGAGVV